MMINGQPVTVVKIGGALLSDARRLDVFWDQIRLLRVDSAVVVVHGGGPQSTEMARRLGHEPRIVHGRRVTTDLDLDVLHWTVRGSLNTRLVAAALAHGVRAVGISGVDGNTVRVDRRPPWRIDGDEVDFGWVGDVREVSPDLLRTLLDDGYVPVVAPVAVDGAGQTYNVNADTVAKSVALALSAERFVLVTESGGVREQADDPASHLSEIRRSTYETGSAAGWIAGGMLVKLRVAFDALAAGVNEVFIVPPEGLRDGSSGTRVVA